ncbi:MAG TPA: response regulator [archaeon]|nr:response regulator [archaeon]
MAKEKIFVVEDDENIQELLRYNLSREGYQVEKFTSGEEVLLAVRSRLPDLVILDLMLPGVDGLEVGKRLRENPKTRHVPIVMLTAKGEEADIVTGLELGADDYITKPFSLRVLIARIRAVLRKKAAALEGEKPVIRAGGLVIDSGRYVVHMEDQPVELTSSEFKLLNFLARRPGWVFTRRQIVGEVHGTDYPVTDRSVDVAIVGLRKKLGKAGDYIETVRGAGYRFRE